MPRLPPADACAAMTAAFCGFAGYHAPQPLYPAISQSLGLSASTVSLLSTCMILPLGLAPAFYGVFLLKWPLARTLAASLCLYAAGLLPGPLGMGFAAMIAGRIIQGLTLPAIMVCAMTYLACRFQGQALQKALSLYAFIVILGSFSGRLLAGAAESICGSWRLALCANFFLVICALPLCPLLKSLQSPRKGFDFRAVGRLLRQKHMLRLLLLPTAMLMASTSFLQMLPFRLAALDPQIPAFAISLVYTGIILCSTTGLFAPKILASLKHEMTGVIGAMAVFLLFLPGLALPSIPALAACLILMNFGFAFIYVSMPGIINRCAKVESSVANGVYLAFYYTSAAIGSYFPLLIYENCAFPAYLACMFCLTLASLATAWPLRGLIIEKDSASR